MRYEIDEQTFAVSIYEDEQNVPFWFQPDYPNYDPALDEDGIEDD